MKLKTRKINGKKTKKHKKIFKKTRKLNRKNNKNFIGGNNETTTIFENNFNTAMHNFDYNEIITIDNVKFNYIGQGHGGHAYGVGRITYKTDENVYKYINKDINKEIICKEYVGKFFNNTISGYGVMKLKDQDNNNQYKWVGSWVNGMLLKGIKYEFENENKTWTKYEDGYYINIDKIYLDIPKFTFDKSSETSENDFFKVQMETKIMEIMEIVENKYNNSIKTENINDNNNTVIDKVISDTNTKKFEEQRGNESTLIKGTLIITDIKCSNMPTRTLFGDIEPFVKFTIGKEECSTEHIPSNGIKSATKDFNWETPNCKINIFENNNDINVEVIDKGTVEKDNVTQGKGNFTIDLSNINNNIETNIKIVKNPKMKLTYNLNVKYRYEPINQIKTI
jgi:hypothetical protein